MLDALFKTSDSSGGLPTWSQTVLYYRNISYRLHNYFLAKTNGKWGTCRIESEEVVEPKCKADELKNRFK
jgi:hypothetical protein